jgi:hypothetical protein
VNQTAEKEQKPQQSEKLVTSKGAKNRQVGTEEGEKRRVRRSISADTTKDDP